jgi:molybdopterin-guanine dinucleotide biosynthesis protein A
MDGTPPRCAVLILAGGRSRRMRQDKRRLRLSGPTGPTLLESVVARVAPLSAECLVVMNDCRDWPQLTVPCLADDLPGSGVFGALLTGLRRIRAGAALVIAADMPLLVPELVQYMLSWPADSLLCAADAAPSGRIHPLLARYPAALLPQLEAAFTAGERRLQTLITALPHQLVPDAAWQQYDPQRRSLWNLNSPADLAALHQSAS